MHTGTRQIFFIIVFFCFLTKGYTQITANPSSGCAPLSVQFSGPSGATNVLWNFGSLGTTTISNPNPIYTTAGSYNVTYTAIVNGNPVSYSTSITAGNPPSATYVMQLPASHCVPLTASFTASGASPGSTYSWAFGDLTPLGTGNSVTHAYGVSGSFIPVVIVTDAATGCTAVVQPSGNNSVVVSDLPTLQIGSGAGFVGCAPPFVTSFDGSNSTSGSPLGGGLTMTWQFNAGTPNTGSGPNPGAVSFGQGSHAVMLIATDNNFCIDTLTLPVTVVNPTLSATVDPTICINKQVDVFVNSPQSIVSVSTTAGTSGVFTVVPNTVDTLKSVCIFSTPGNHQIFITISSIGSCPPLTIVKSVFVEEIVASFTSVPPYTSCQPTMVATFTNMSTVNNNAQLTYSFWPAWGGISYWNASPNQVTTTSLNQTATFAMSAGSQNPYTIFWQFNPVFTLKVVSSNGCMASALNSDYYLTRTTARFTKNTQQGCAPLSVQLRDTSYTDNSLYPIVSYTWNSGTTPPVVYTNTNMVTFTYTAPGIYYPSFTVQTSAGCTDTYGDTIYVTSPPTVTATVPSSVCAGVPVTINLSGNTTSTVNAGIGHWHVTTDEGYFSGCITDNTPTFPFTHIGTQTVSLSAYQWNCGQTYTTALTVNVKGPLGKFVVINHCAGNKKQVDFDIHLQDVATATLNFGDNTPVQLITGNLGADMFASYSHVYAASGDYTVVLTSNNPGSGCANRTFTRVVKVRQPVARITVAGQPIPVYPSALACTKSAFNFSGLASSENIVSCKTGYKWWFSGPGFVNPPLNCKDGVYATHFHGPTMHMADPVRLDTFRVAGTYTIQLEVKDENGCADTAKVKFRISNAVPVFTFNANPVCLSDGSVQVINTTQDSLVPPDVITNYTFSFGNGTILTSTNAVFNPTVNYPVVSPPSQTFQVMAIAVNQLNCRDTTYHTLQVNNPYPGLVSNNLFPCIPLGQLSNAVNFSAAAGYNTYSFTAGTPTGNPTWQSTTNFSNVARYYTTPGIYVPTLTVVDAANCKASNSLTITALGQPTASIKNLGASGFCVPAKIRLVDSSAINVSPISNYQWSFGTFTSQGSPTDTALENILPLPGVYTISLWVSVGGNYSCLSSMSKIIHVYDTKADLAIDKTKFCLGDNITVTAKNLKDVYGWQWFFGDLVPQSLIYNVPFTSNPLVYNYATFPPGSTDGKTTLLLKAVSDNMQGCVVTKTVAIQVIKIDGDFVQSDSIYRHCLNLKEDKFISTTPNPLSLYYTYEWDFGQGAADGGDSESFTYLSAGVYPVTMRVTDTTYSCKAIAIKNMTILPLPKAVLFASDSLVCPKDTFTLRVEASPVTPGLLTLNLQPNVFSQFPLPVSNTASAAITTSVNTNYILSVTDINNCESPADTQLVEVPPVPTQVNTATTIIIGQTLTLTAPQDNPYSYYWWPETKDLSDSTIANPVTSSMSDIIYTVTLVDEPRRCWSVPSTFTVIVLPYSSIDVPTAFTPNGDGVNDVIFPDGWGIKKIKYFRVYNRWGQLLFETNIYKQGWDGTFEGVPQNMDTYVYQAEIEGYAEEYKSLVKSGAFKLIR